MKKFEAFIDFIREEVEPNLGIYGEVTDKAKHGLSKLLADLHVAFIKVHNFHWNVIGQFFGPLHALFDSVYGHLGEHIDKVAERIRAIGGVAPGSMKEYLEMATLTEERGESRPTHEMLFKLVADLEHLSSAGRELIEEVDGDEGTMNLLADFVEQIDKDAWVTRTHLNT